MVKNLIILIVIFSSFTAYTYEQMLEAEIVVLEAPAFRIQDSTSQVIQYFRKGDVVKLHPIHDISNPLARNYVFYTNVQDSNELVDLENYFIDEEKRVAFYKIIDRNGKPAYLLKEHVKPIYNDIREYQKLITDYYPDQTDYRIEEPLPENYPFLEDTGYRASFLYGVGLPSTYDYAYQVSPNSSDEQPSQNFVFNYLVQADNEPNSRIYYGLDFVVSNSRRFTNFTDGETGKESVQQIGVGPTVSFDVYRGEKYRFIFQTSMIVNFIDRLHISAGIEQQKFSGTSITPLLKFFYQRDQVLKGFDFIIGPTIRVHLPRELQTREDNRGGRLTQQGGFQKKVGADVSLIAGFQTSF